LVACDRAAEDTPASKSAQQQALERDLDLALRPDTPARAPVLINDLPAPADSPATAVPALIPPPPAPPPPLRETPPPARAPRPRPEPPRPENKPRREPEAPAPAGPEYTSRTAQAGQFFQVSFDRSVSARADAGSTFTATLSEPLLDEMGRTVIPAGATVTGRVSAARRGHSGFEFTSISYAGERYGIEASVVTGPVTRQVNLDSNGERVAKVAAPAAAGAVLGRIIGGNRRGAVVGAVVGAAAGAAASGATADVDTVVDPGATATIRLDGPVTVRRRLE
jgi:hypothetical protein